MRYWILSLTEENYLIARKHSLIATTSRQKKAFERLREGDRCTFYLTKKTGDTAFEGITPIPIERPRFQHFAGEATIAGPLLEDNLLLWPPRQGEIYPYRRKAIFEAADRSVFAPPLACELSVVKHPLYWMLPFRSGIVEISAADWNLLQRSLAS